MWTMHSNHAFLKTEDPVHNSSMLGTSLSHASNSMPEAIQPPPLWPTLIKRHLVYLKDHFSPRHLNVI